MELQEQLKLALTELRKNESKKFKQTVDLIVNLQKFEVKKTPLNIFVRIPNKSKDKKIAAFFESESEFIDTITEIDFKKYSDKKKLKNLVKKYDFFIAQAKLMPKVATVFGRVLGPAGKMPSPKLGILVDDSEKNVKELVERINKTIRVQTKEPSIKVSIGKLSMKDSELIENATQVYNSILNELPNNKDNIKSVMIKSTMSKSLRVEM